MYATLLQRSNTLIDLLKICSEVASTGTGGHTRYNLKFITNAERGVKKLVFLSSLPASACIFVI